MFSQKSLTIMLLVVVGILSYQTVVLAGMSVKLKDAQIGLGAGAGTVSFDTGGSAPQMVGGC